MLGSSETNICQFAHSYHQPKTCRISDNIFIKASCDYKLLMLFETVDLNFLFRIAWNLLKLIRPKLLSEKSRRQRRNGLNK